MLIDYLTIGATSRIADWTHKRLLVRFQDAKSRAIASLAVEGVWQSTFGHLQAMQKVLIVGGLIAKDTSNFPLLQECSARVVLVLERTHDLGVLAVTHRLLDAFDAELVNAIAQHHSVSGSDETEADGTVERIDIHHQIHVVERFE